MFREQIYRFYAILEHHLLEFQNRIAAEDLQKNKWKAAIINTNKFSREEQLFTINNKIIGADLNLLQLWTDQSSKTLIED